MDGAAKLGCSESRSDSPVHSNSIKSSQSKMAINKSGLAVSPANAPQPPGKKSPDGQSLSLTPSVRHKVILMPGRSLMDWIRLGRSGQDLTGVGGKVFDVTLEDLKKHTTPDDFWMAIRGKVYNVTPYIEYHPGGPDELYRGAGIDSTQIFDEVHKWVNAESMLEKCYIGKLVTESTTGGKGSGTKAKSSSALSPNGTIAATFKAPQSIPTSSPPTYDWFQSSKAVTIAVYTKWKKISKDYVSIDRNDQDLLITLEIEHCIYKIHVELQEDITSEYSVKTHSDSGKVEILLPKVDVDKQWTALGRSLPGDKSYKKTSEIEIMYRECTIESVKQLNYNVRLLCIVPPKDSRVGIPVGHHVHIKHLVSGMELVRSYTVVLPSLNSEEQDKRVEEGKAIYLMIKIYSEGALTPWISTLQAGDKLTVSESTGTFDMSHLHSMSQLIMFAAGTGFTPMIRLIYHAIMVDNEIGIQLMMYHKTEKDIVWKDELNTLAATCQRFQVTYILSEVEDGGSWSGLKGHVNKTHVKDVLVSGTEKTFLCACGPRLFTEAVIKLAKEQGCTDANLHAFFG